MRAIITVAMTAQTTDAGNDGFVSVAEAARATGIPIRTLYHRIRIGAVEAQAEDGRLRLRLADVQRATVTAQPQPRSGHVASQMPIGEDVRHARERVALLRLTRDERREAAQLEQDEADRQTRVQQAELVAAQSRLELARQRWQFEREQQRAAEEARADGLRKAREAARVRFDAHQRAKREEWCAEWIDASYGWAIEHLGHSEGPTAVIAARRALRECTPDDPADMVRGAITAELRSGFSGPLCGSRKPRGSASRKKAPLRKQLRPTTCSCARSSRLCSTSNSLILIRLQMRRKIAPADGDGNTRRRRSQELSM